jgi:hypothetical protein
MINEHGGINGRCSRYAALSGDPLPGLSTEAPPERLAMRPTLA